MIVIQSMDELRTMVRAILEEGRDACTVTEPMTVDQLARATGMHADTIRKRVRSGEIRRVPHTARILIPARECERICNGR